MFGNVEHSNRANARWIPNNLVDWCFKPSQPRRIISGLKETFIKRYKVEKSNKAKIRPEEQSKKEESCRENLRTKIWFKGL